MGVSPSIARGSIPAGYREVLHWNISQLGGGMIRIQALAGVAFCLGLAGYLLLAFALGTTPEVRVMDTVGAILSAPYNIGLEIGRQLAGETSGSGGVLLIQTLGNILLAVGILIGLQVLLVFLHEGVHGLAMVFFGARPAFGFLPKGLMFYATSPGYAFSRTQFLWVAILPLISLNLLFLLALLLPIGLTGSVIVAVLAALNIGGAVGDLWIMAIVLKYPPTAYIGDEKDGMRIFLPEEDSIPV